MVEEANTGSLPEPEPESPSVDDVFEAVHGYKPSESPEEAAKQMFLEGLVPATQTLVNLAINGNTEKVRLEASRYIVERNLGKLVERLPIGDMWEQLLKEIQVEKKE
jgi:hypothetical protein